MTTECALPPNPLLFSRRSSIRRGTVASISKDVRVNDNYVEEIIKKQKAIQQQERVENTSLLKRRHSMLSMRAPSIKPSINTKSSLLLRSRTRTMSNTDLKGNCIQQQQKVSQQQQQQQQQQQAKTTKQSNLTDKIRLETTTANDGALYNHLRKCSACCIIKEQTLPPSPTTTTDEDNDDNSSIESSISHNHHHHISPSTSTSSSTSSSIHHIHRPFLNPKNTCSSNLLLWKPTIEERRDHVILQDLNSSITSFSHQIKELMEMKSNNKKKNITSYYDSSSSSSDDDDEEEDYKQKIQECKALVAQQQKLLAQLEKEQIQATPKDDDKKPLPPPPPSISSIYQVYKNWTLPKSFTSQLIIKQKADKNELDTIISVQGVCTTVESSLIPDKLLSSTVHDITTFNHVYQFNYTIDISYDDRVNKFILMDTQQWQSDKSTHICSFKQCKQEFNWIQRKHHCRGCGHIFCNLHSNNRLPLFNLNKTKQPIFSRVCDKCFFRLVNGDSLTPLHS